MSVVERPIRTRAATPEYEVGYVMTFRRCPACNKKMVCDLETSDPATGDLANLEMHCPDVECGERVWFDLSDPADDKKVSVCDRCGMSGHLSSRQEGKVEPAGNNCRRAIAGGMGGGGI